MLCVVSPRPVTAFAAEEAPKEEPPIEELSVEEIPGEDDNTPIDSTDYKIIAGVNAV